MKLNKIVERLNARVFHMGNTEREIQGGYAGDFLSFVMGRAPADCAWFTVMTNINVSAVATLADVGVVVLCEGVEPSDPLMEKAVEHNINLIGTELDIFEAVRVYCENAR